MNLPKKYLTEKIILTEARIDDKSILRILTQNKQIDKANPDYNYYTQLANWANSTQEKTGKIDLSTIKLSDRSLIQKGKLANNTKHLGATLEQLKNLMDREGKYDPKNELSNLIQKTTLEILVGLKNPKQSNEPEEQKLYAGMDWTAEKARRLKNANGKATSEILDEFYNDYYKIEYAGLDSPEANDTTGIVDKLKSLDKILIQEFTKLGYNPSVNPLAQFLKILIELKKENASNIFDKLRTDNYGAIHNSFIRKHITGNMLGNYSEKNILFCDDLYNYKGLDIVNYLSLQAQTLQKAESDSKYSDDPGLLVSKIFIQQKPLADTFEENVKELFKPETTADKIMLPGKNSTAKLRSELEIIELYNHIFKTIPKKDLTLSAADELSAKAEKQGIMLSMIRYLLDTDRLTEKEQNKYEEWFKLFNYQRNQEKINQSKKMLSDFTINYKAVKLILGKLQTRVEIKRKETKAKN